MNDCCRELSRVHACVLWADYQFQGHTDFRSEAAARRKVQRLGLGRRSGDGPSTLKELVDHWLQYQWNIGLEQFLGSSQSLSLTYVGAVGRDLLRSTVLNPASAGNPDFDFVFLTNNSATSNYNALQLKFQRRFSKGLHALASYSFSHSIDISSTDAAFAHLDPVGSVTNPNTDRGDSDFDIRHSFTAAVTDDPPTLGGRNLIHNILGNWSLDSFVIIRSAPPVDIVARKFLREWPSSCRART